jgi:hypothetical protein
MVRKGSELFYYHKEKGKLFRLYPDCWGVGLPSPMIFCFLLQRCHRRGTGYVSARYSVANAWQQNSICHQSFWSDLLQALERFAPDLGAICSTGWSKLPVKDEGVLRQGVSVCSTLWSVLLHPVEHATVYGGARGGVWLSKRPHVVEQAAVWRKWQQPICCHVAATP